jgi:hypothetical protein
VKKLHELLIEKKGVLILPDFVFFHENNDDSELQRNASIPSSIPSSILSTIPHGQFFRVGLGRKNFPDCLKLFDELLSEEFL